jgi:hypothetical protein
MSNGEAVCDCAQTLPVGCADQAQARVSAESWGSMALSALLTPPNLSQLV